MSNQYKQLTQTERYQIEALSKLRFSARKIATELGRSNKSISRERLRCTATPYCAESAHRQALEKRTLALKFDKRSAAEVKKSVNSLLILWLSPELRAGSAISLEKGRSIGNEKA